MQDLGLLQILLACDDTDQWSSQAGTRDNSGFLIDYMIDNFGLDGQLSKLFQAINNNKLIFKELEACKNFDHAKLKTEIILFLKLMIQTCICEVSFLKQLYTVKEDQQAFSDNNFEKSIWESAIKKEAVHLLLLNKFNVGIEELRSNMLEVFKKDERFENMLFEVSTQGRDIKN